MEETRYLLIGGGVASVWAAQNIRERDTDGRIIMVGNEKHPPYDKPPLSKQYLLKDDYTADDAYSKFDHFYPDNRVELLRGVSAKGIDRAARRVTLEDGAEIRYEKLLLATGASPRKLNVPGSRLDGIYTLRRIEDSEAIRAAIRSGKRGVIIGAGYIGMEVASACIQRGIETTVVERMSQPWPAFASKTLGAFLRSYYEAKGVRFIFDEEVTAFEGRDRLQAVLTGGGKRLEADFAVVGIGVTLNTELARSAGLEVDDREGVRVSANLQTSDPNIWAAGDIACFEDVVTGGRWHAEHHLNAKWQGRAVGAIMAGEQKPYDQVAYFFSDVLDIHMALRGAPVAGSPSTILGDLNGAEFVELYHDATGRLLTGIAISHEEPKLDPISDKLEELIRARAGVGGLTASTFGL